MAATKDSIDAGLNQQVANLGAVQQGADQAKASADATAQAGLADGNFIGELQALDLNAIIGGPLCSAIKGMTQAAAVTLDFIKTVCFQPGQPLGEPIMVEFELTRPGGLFGMMAQKTKIQVPFLTMVNIPHLRLSKVRVEFNVHLTSTRTASIGSTSNTSVISTTNLQKDQKKDTSRWQTQDTTTYKYQRDQWNPWWWYWQGSDTTHTETPISTDHQDWTQTATMVGVTSNTSQNSAGATLAKDYSLNIVVTAVQDELPRGLEKILDILENQINEAADDKLGDMLMKNMMSSLGASMAGTGTGASASTASTGLGGQAQTTNTQL